MRTTAVKTSRGIGWALGIVGGLVLAGYGVYEFATDEATEAVVKVSVAAVTIGLVLLFLSVLLERLHGRKTDRYKDVEL